MERVAVIGAGLAGLAAAARLAEAGTTVNVFEKLDTIGGRLATRQSGDNVVDLGAAFVTVRKDAFQNAVQAAVFAGHATGWSPRGKTTDEPWIIGLPDMAGLVRDLGSGLNVALGLNVERIGSTSEGYLLQTAEGGQGPFDAVIVAVAASQAQQLLQAHGKPFNFLAGVNMRPTITGVFVFDEPLASDVDVITPDGVIDMAYRNNSRAGRDGSETWVVQASADWLDRPAEEHPDKVASKLFEVFGDVVGRLPMPAGQTSHYWHHALVENPLGVDFLEGLDRRLAACGDWCLEASAEAAFMSGRAAAEALLQ